MSQGFSQEALRGSSTKNTFDVSSSMDGSHCFSSHVVSGSFDSKSTMRAVK